MINAGIIEGFYGRSWQHQERLDLLSHLASNGFGHYCYAPKSNALLRKHWQALLPKEQFNELQAISQHCQSLGLDFEVGLSPIGLLHDWNAKSRQQLLAKLKQLKQLNIRSLALLFDDIPSDLANMAALQIEITEFVQETLPDCQLLFCPSFYSFDPVLTDVFGAMPEDYWLHLGEGLSADVSIFWTGDKVISQAYPAQGLQQISQQFKRQPIIWDNSLANDGRKTSPYLHCQPMAVTQQKLPPLVQRISFNPMNQAAVAAFVLPGFFKAEQSFESLWQSLPKNLEHALNNHADILMQQGLNDLNAKKKQAMREIFCQFSNPIAITIVQWLDGMYQFDPECLT